MYCDHCGDPINDKECHPWGVLPVDIDSANAGESAVVCVACHEHIMRLASKHVPGFDRRIEDIRNGLLKREQLSTVTIMYWCEWFASLGRVPQDVERAEAWIIRMEAEIYASIDAYLPQEGV